MSTKAQDEKTYDKKTAAFAGFVIQNIPCNLDEETMDNWMQNPAALKILLAGLLPSMFTRLAEYLTLETSATPTSACFTSSIWCDRDVRFDGWLRPRQPERDAQLVTLMKARKDSTFVEFAQAVLGVTTVAVRELGNLLVERGHTLTLTQVERLVEGIEEHKDNVFSVDGYASFFFVQTEDEEVPVVVGIVTRYGVRNWKASISRLDRDTRWDTSCRFLLCNAANSKL